MFKELIGSISVFKSRDDDDVIDRLHYFVTANLLIALAILVSFKQFGGNPMECMVPQELPPSWGKYVENYCWAQDIYILPTEGAKASSKGDPRSHKMISYYQWVPFLLLVVAGCFWFPAIIRKMLAGYSGITVGNIIKMASDRKNIKPNIRKSTIQMLTVHLEHALKFHRRLDRYDLAPHRHIKCLNLPYSAFYVTLTYLVTKGLFLVNVIVQFAILNKVMIGNYTNYTYYGWGALNDMISGSTWHTSGMFPRTTLCDFETHSAGTIAQHYQVQCVLAINLFNEKIFVFLWFWFLILAVLTLASFAYWTCLMVMPWTSRGYITRHLEQSEIVFNWADPLTKGNIRKFVRDYLRTDGVFVIRMTTMHTNVIFGTDLVASLWRSFNGIEEAVQRRVAETGDNIETTDSPTEDSSHGSNKFNILRFLNRDRENKDAEAMKLRNTQ